MKNKSPNNTKLIIIILAVVMVVFVGLGIGGYFLYKTFSKAYNATNLSGTKSKTPTSQNQTKPTLKLEDYNGGFFTIKKPVGWQVTVGGNCATFSFVIQNSDNPAQMIFYFGEIGPVYLSENQKQIDKNYMSMGGYTVQWLEMPVVQPLNPENFLKTMNQISATSFTKQFMTTLPELADVEIISSSDAANVVPGKTKLIRAVFKEKGVPANGLFFLTTTELLPESGMPASGIGYGMTFIGLSSGRSEFTRLEKTLNDSIKSLNVSQDYVSNCITQQNEQTQKILKAGQTLSETSDIIMEGWENRNKSDDILSERRSDVMLGRDRVYDPSSGNVYDVENGWYDDYNINRQEFKMSNLERLPENNWDLWTAPTKDAKEID